MLFRIGIPSLLLILQFIVFIRSRNWIRQKFRKKKWVAALHATWFVIMNGALLFLIIVRPRASDLPPVTLYLAYPFFIWHGATIFIGLILLIAIIIKSPFRLLNAVLKRIPATHKQIAAVQTKPAYIKFDASRRTFIRRSMYGLSATAFGASAYGMLLGKSQYEVTNVHYPIRNLPPQLHGFTIGLVSDIHSSINMTKREMDGYVKIVNSLQPDLILVTGDFVNSMTEEVYPFAEAFSNLQAPHGVYGVMGNHDFFAPQPETVAKEIDACGVKLLRNDKVVIKKKGGAFYLLGVDDISNAKGAEDAINAALGYAPVNIPKVLMMHRPYFLEQAANRDIDLVLSGHTHGGQVVLAKFGNTTIAPASLASKYIWGKYSIGKTQMYVNRGIGTVGLPIRLNCPPEITKITLIPALPARNHS